MLQSKRAAIAPQPGFQENFLSTCADIAIGAGAAGAGKTYALLLEPVRHVKNRRFGGVIFRRESGQLTNEGGPWDTALSLYAPLVRNPERDFVSSPKHQARFKYGSRMTFSHMQLLKHMYQWDGSQIPYIGFDELQHFIDKQFWYMFSRNRSTCGVRPYMRGTCNPDPDSFLRFLLEWWIDQKTGDPLRERSGVIRYFIRESGEIIWSSDKETLLNKYPRARPKSFTFVMGELRDNKILLEQDPEYESNIDAMLDYERLRLRGNWFARPRAGELFKRGYFTISNEVPEMKFMTRYWDRAATLPTEDNQDPDYTAGVLLGIDYFDRVWVLDVQHERLDPGDVQALVHRTTLADTIRSECGLEQEPGASGKYEVAAYENWMINHGIECYIRAKTSNRGKLTCWKPAARHGKNVGFMMKAAEWNEIFLAELEGVTDGTQKGHDDQTDAFAGAFSRCQEEILEEPVFLGIPSVL